MTLPALTDGVINRGGTAQLRPRRCLRGLFDYGRPRKEDNDMYNRSNYLQAIHFIIILSIRIEQIIRIICDIRIYHELLLHINRSIVQMQGSGLKHCHPFYRESAVAASR